MDESRTLRKNMANVLYFCLAVILPGHLLKLIAGITFLVNCVKKPHIAKWIGLFAYEAIVLVNAICYTNYYNMKPGYGIMPGLSYIGEVALGMLASGIFCILLFVSILICFARNNPAKENKS